MFEEMYPQEAWVSLHTVTQTYIHTRKQTGMYTHTNTHSLTHTHIYKHTQTHIHTYTDESETGAVKINALELCCLTR